MKSSSKKTPLASLPAAGVIHGAEACDYGNNEGGHEAYDWRTGKYSMMVGLSAILRHAYAVLDGEDFAPDSETEHLGHIIADAAVLLDAKYQGTLDDDRPPKGTAAQVLERLKELRESRKKKEEK